MECFVMFPDFPGPVVDRPVVLVSLAGVEDVVARRRRREDQQPANGMKKWIGCHGFHRVKFTSGWVQAVSNSPGTLPLALGLDETILART